MCTTALANHGEHDSGSEDSLTCYQIQFSRLQLMLPVDITKVSSSVSKPSLTSIPKKLSQMKNGNVGIELSG